jgi:hypothetical protein
MLSLRPARNRLSRCVSTRLGLAKNGNSTATYNFLHLCDKASAISLCRNSSAWTSGTRIFNKSLEVGIPT